MPIGEIKIAFIGNDDEFLNTDQNYKIYHDGMCIGEYRSEEKAMKVLDEIQKHYGKYLYVQGGQMAMENYYVPPFGFTPPKIFEMPQEDDI